MQDNKCGDKLAAALKGQNIDILINNAGYFYEPVEKIDSLNFEEVTNGGKFFPDTFFPVCACNSFQPCSRWMCYVYRS